MPTELKFKRPMAEAEARSAMVKYVTKWLHLPWSRPSGLGQPGGRSCAMRVAASPTCWTTRRSTGGRDRRATRKRSRRALRLGGGVVTLPQTFRILAIPFSGPIPKRGTDGVDLDGEYFSSRTATRADAIHIGG
jgi:hypothetical protein